MLSSQHATTYWHSKPRQVEPIRWQRGEVIGQGAYGTVYLGLNLDTGELMAVKQLDAKEVSEKENTAGAQHEKCAARRARLHANTNQAHNAMPTVAQAQIQNTGVLAS